MLDYEHVRKEHKPLLYWGGGGEVLWEFLGSCCKLSVFPRSSFCTVIARERERKVTKMVLLSGGGPVSLDPQVCNIFCLPSCVLACLKPLLTDAFRRWACFVVLFKIMPLYLWQFIKQFVLAFIKIFLLSAIVLLYSKYVIKKSSHPSRLLGGNWTNKEQLSQTNTCNYSNVDLAIESHVLRNIDIDDRRELRKWSFPFKKATVITLTRITCKYWRIRFPPVTARSIIFRSLYLKKTKHTEW